MMNQHIADLLDVIEQEQQCCSRLIEVSRSEQRSVAANNLDELNRRIAEMQEAVTELHKRQNARKKLLQSLAKDLDVGADNVTLYVLADRLDPDVAQEVRQRFRQLHRTGETLYRVNQQTIYLINFSLDLIERQVSAWTSALTEREGYDSDGQSRDTRTNAKIIEEKV